MELNSQTVRAMYNSFNVIFNKAFQETEPIYTKVAMTVPSTTREETYTWLGSFPSLREWLGDRTVKRLSKHGYSIVNKDWEATVSVGRNDIEDDRIGIYKPMIEELGRSAALHPDEIVFSLLKDGFTEKCYDGKPFFATNHPVGKQSISNLIDGTQTSPWYVMDLSKAVKPLIYQNRRSPQFVSFTKLTDESVFFKKEFIFGVDCRDNAGFGLWQLAVAAKVELTPDNFAEAVRMLSEMKNEEKRPLAVQATHLIVPPRWRHEALTIAKAEQIEGTTNVWRGTVDVIVVPWLA